ncbi:hypothetical protein EDD86DRAFT_246873 [Gorgonomyces haynaldii]|nr:hypothetical protein EDD86DRAFT_246873 [Gorgonomyces haynaldii]
MWLYVLLGFYLVAVAIIVSSLVCFWIAQQKLTKRFLIYGTVITTSILIGFLIVLLFLLTVSEDCNLSRQLSYAFFFFGFLVYDYYQLVNLEERIKKRDWLLVVLFFVRVGSIILSFVDIKGDLALKKSVDGLMVGPCRSAVEPWVVYQEHAVVCVYELYVVYLIFRHAYSFTSETLHFWDMLTTVLDFEALSFVGFMVCEIVYLILFSTIPGSFVSYMNTIYLLFPVVLFWATCVYQMRNRKSFKMEKLTRIQKQRTGSSHSKKQESGHVGKSHTSALSMEHS